MGVWAGLVLSVGLSLSVLTSNQRSEPAPTNFQSDACPHTKVAFASELSVSHYLKGA
jgi:hypothetical protein